MTHSLIQQKIQDTLRQAAEDAEAINALAQYKQSIDVMLPFFEAFNVQVKKVEVAQSYYPSTYYLDVNIKVADRFAEAAPVVEVMERFFGECEHMTDSTDWRMFNFRDAPVRLFIYAGEGCQKIEVVSTHTETKFLC